MKINWMGDGGVIDGFVNGKARYQIDYNSYHKNWTLYGPEVDPNGEAFDTSDLAEKRAEKLEGGKHV